VILSLLLERKNQLAEAESLAREAFAVGVKVHGANHPSVWGLISNLGTLRLDRGDPQGAERLLRDALARSKRVGTGRDPDQGDVLNRLAYVAIILKAADANDIYREAVAFDNSRQPGEADFVTDGVHFLGMAQQLEGDNAAAARSYRRSLAIYEKQLPPDHPYRLAAAKGLAEVTK
jgi:hypothetical protein